MGGGGAEWFVRAVHLREPIGWGFHAYFLLLQTLFGKSIPVDFDFWMFASDLVTLFGFCLRFEYSLPLQKAFGTKGLKL